MSRRSARALGLLAWAALPWLLEGRLSLSILVFIALYTPVVIGLSLLAGYAGQVSLGQATFYGVGAYTLALLTTRAGWDPWPAAAAAVAVTGLLAYAVGAPVLMLRGHYLVVGTLGLNIVFEVLMRQWYGLTGGSNGLAGIPSLALFGVRLAGDRAFYYLAGLLALAAIVLSANLVRSRAGRALQAIHASEAAAETLGVDPTRHKLQVFVWSAALAGAAGALYACYLNFVSPSPFSFQFSVELLMMAVIGGIASIPGAVLGAAVAVLLREGLRSVAPALLGSSAAEYEIVLYGILLAVFVIAAPEGLWPRLARRLARDVPARRAARARPLPLEQPAGDRPLLRVEGAGRRFGGLVAVEGVSFEVRPGEVLAIIGPNGAGKTTLFNLVSGVLRPGAGRILLDGRHVEGWPAHRVAALGVARTFQTPRLIPDLTALENVMTGLHRHLRSGFVRSLLGLTAAEEQEAAERALGALEAVGAAEVADRPAAELPFGVLRRVELARALVTRPRLLLLDEPGSGLSGAEKAELARVVRRLRDAGVAVLLVEHDVGFVMELADRVLVLDRGRRIAEGLPEQVRRDPAVIAAYLGGAEPGDRAPASRSGAGGTPGRAPRLRVSDLHAGYGAVPVLHGIDFEVAPGELVVILGPNGAGKTTLMRAVAGLLPCRGEVLLDGRPVQGLPAERLARLGLALVPERRQLLETMSVRDHLTLGAYTRYRREPRQALAADVERVLQLLPALRDKLEQPARALSGGQQQMVALARALMARPRVLLLDEPLLGLAPRVVAEFMETVAGMRDQGLALVVVEQNALAVLPYADRAYVLEGGRVALSGSGERLLRAPELQGVFLGGSLGGGGSDERGDGGGSDDGSR